MDTVGLREAKDRLSALVKEVEAVHARYVITRHGDPAAVLISIEDLESMEETIEVLSTPGLLDAIRQSDAEAARGEGDSLAAYVIAREANTLVAHDERTAAPGGCTNLEEKRSEPSNIGGASGPEIVRERLSRSDPKSDVSGTTESQAHADR